MTDILLCKFSPSIHTIESAVGDETVLLHLENGTYYGLDPVGTQIWEGLKNGRLPKDICVELAANYGVEVDVVEADARRFLGDLKMHSIVVDG